MSLLVANCPRCGAHNITFDVTTTHYVGKKYSWQFHYEAFCVCRRCHKSTVYILELAQAARSEFFAEHGPTAIAMLNDDFKATRFICIRDMGAMRPPDHVPETIANAFTEGATSLATECWNAAGTMFRLVIDLSTRPLLPKEEVEGLNKRIRRDLGLRLPWLFKTGRLPPGLEDLSHAVREDGNDGAHQGTLTREDAFDLADFTSALLERLFTEPEKLKLAQARRAERRQPKQPENE